jgi:hypothetical protein
MNKVARQVAELDFTKWLDFRKVGVKKRADSKAQEDEIIAGIESGEIVIEENFYITQKLQHPITNPQGEVTVSELKFKPRIFVKELNAKLRALPTQSSPDDRIAGYIAALTEKPFALVGELDTEDYRLSSNIVMYFL